MSKADGASSTGNPIVHIRALRREAAREIERLIAFLDRTDGDPDVEDDTEDDDNADCEPSLGSVAVNENITQTCWSLGCNSDRELDADLLEAGDEEYAV